MVTSGTFWAGFATPFLLIAFGWALLSVIAWVRWWSIDPETTFRGGWGYRHEHQTRYPADGHDPERWVWVTHVHYWPPDTPKWLGRRLEPLRVRHCLRDPDRRDHPVPHPMEGE